MQPVSSPFTRVWPSPNFRTQVTDTLPSDGLNLGTLRTKMSNGGANIVQDFEVNGIANFIANTTPG